MKLTKKYSKTYIVIEPDYEMSDDGWFVAIRYRAKRGDKVTHEETVTEPDVENVVKILKRNGYEEF